MSAQQGCNDDKAVVDSFKEALIQRIGAEQFRMWFTRGVKITVLADADAPGGGGQSLRRGGPVLSVSIHGQFAYDRLRKNCLREMRAAAHVAGGSESSLRVELEAASVQAELPLGGDEEGVSAVTARGGSDAGTSGTSKRHGGTNRRMRRASPSGRAKRTRPLSTLIREGVTNKSDRDARALRHDRPARPASESRGPGSDSEGAGTQSEGAVQPGLPNLTLPERPAGGPSKSGQRDVSALADPATNSATSSPSEEMSVSNFVLGASNRLAHTAMVMACQSPASASPLFLCGPTGVGKTHLLTAIASQFRRHHRMRRVIHLSAEQFTNDFISSVGNSGITSFRRRYREVDALLIDDVQFLGSKRATLREMLYTVETLIGAGRPMVFSGNEPPTEIPGLTRELAGRLAGGLLCPIQTLDSGTRETLLRRSLQSRCAIDVPDDVVTTINSLIAGDGRAIRGIANLIHTLQRMFGRMPSMDEIREFGGDLLGASKPVASLTAIEHAVCQAFHLGDADLRASSQTRVLSEPRMLAMYLARELTSSAYSEIGSHFGGRSHSTAIAAGKNVRGWIDQGKTIGRGNSKMTVKAAIDRVESLLRSG